MTLIKPGKPPLQSARWLDQVRERIRYLNNSLSTEKVYLYRLCRALASLAGFPEHTGRALQCALPENILSAVFSNTQ